MKNIYEYAVSLDLHTSDKITGSQICEYLGLKGDELEYWDRNGTYWRFESRLEYTDSLEDHIVDLGALVSLERPFEPTDDIHSISLLIGVFWKYDKVGDCTVRLSEKCLETIAAKWPGIRMEIVCYPCSDDDEENIKQKLDK